MTPPAPATPPTPLDALRAKFPLRSTVSYKDTTLRTRRNARTGKVLDVWQTGHGTLVVTLAMNDGGTLDTLPENLTMIRLPHTYVILDELIDHN